LRTSLPLFSRPRSSKTSPLCHFSRTQATTFLNLKQCEEYPGSPLDSPIFNPLYPFFFHFAPLFPSAIGQVPLISETPIMTPSLFPSPRLCSLPKRLFSTSRLHFEACFLRPSSFFPFLLLWSPLLVFLFFSLKRDGSGRYGPRHLLSISRRSSVWIFPVTAPLLSQAFHDTMVPLMPRT